ncbi:MAG: hypothetical protein K6G51_07570 [Sphaerochaetaceae bacterium]|nr:hypothetical protein [Sphaerochaetaceae bacterium]
MMNPYRIIQKRQDINFNPTNLGASDLLSVVLLDSADREKLGKTLDWYLENLNFSIHVITFEDRFEEENLAEIYPDVTFIVFRNLTTIGAMLNSIANVSYSSYLLVTRTDTQLVSFDGEALFSIMEKSEKPAIITPILFNCDMEIMNSLRRPYILGKEIEPKAEVPSIDNNSLHKNLYPIFGIGLYERALFQRMRGFDEEIISDYWQLLDYGIRANLFGNPVYTTSALAFRFYEKHSFIEDNMSCEGIERCYTRALSIRHINGKNILQKWRPYVDKELYKTEVKTRQIVLQKTDFFALMDSWDEEIN